MSIKITNVRLSAGGYLDEHITELKWVNYEDGKHGESARSTLVEWIDGGGKAFVEANYTKVPVLVVRPTGGSAYLRTQANGTWTDNLLALPRF